MVHNKRIYAVVAGGVFAAAAAAMVQRVKDPRRLSLADL
jgi:NaMN:DMB phosphoribosyltransferase